MHRVPANGCVGSDPSTDEHGQNEYLICGLIQQQQLESDQSKIDKYKNTPDYYSIHCVGALPDRCCRRRCWWVLLMTTAALTDLFWGR